MHLLQCRTAKSTKQQPPLHTPTSPLPHSPLALSKEMRRGFRAVGKVQAGAVVIFCFFFSVSNQVGLTASEFIYLYLLYI